MNPSPRVRIAPSPTGYFHVGTGRTALFNWLFARQHGGSFVLRIEDTDSARNRPEYVDGILRAMQWLGLDWDEGPYFQSQRNELYQAAIGRLLAEGAAYACDCTPSEVAERAKRQGDEPLATTVTAVIAAWSRFPAAWCGSGPPTPGKRSLTT